MDFLLGRKMGMTSVFAPDGGTIPVTIIEAGPCTVVQRKTAKVDGYDAVQLGYYPKKEKNLPKSLLGHFKKAGVQPFRVLREVPLGEGDDDLKPGDIVDATTFDRGDRVDVTGKSKGRGFAGVLKRHGFAGGPASHGGMFDRLAGSMGASAYPSKIIKGKKMPGHMGDENVTAVGLLVVDVIPEDNILLLRGAIPGAKNGFVLMKKSSRVRREERKGEQKVSLNPLKASKRAARGA
ncbi:MAG: 50S ribosomal protein L3 [Nitrospinota bacterium]|jgi:large subunit ribosomal protein L3|nr:50S ribosomal protein L3 [Nitrospinota bacterium]